MFDRTIFYTATPQKFIKRLWISFRYHFIAGTIFLLFVILTSRQYNFIIISALIIILVFYFILPFFSSYKWTIRQIISISEYQGLYNLSVSYKDTLQIINIDKEKLTTNLIWEGGRPKILKLIIFNGGNKAIEVFSGGTKALEFELEKIVFELKNNK